MLCSLPEPSSPDTPPPPGGLSTTGMGLQPRAVQARGLQPRLVQGRPQCGLAAFPRETPRLRGRPARDRQGAGAPVTEMAPSVMSQRGDE